MNPDDFGQRETLDSCRAEDKSLCDVVSDLAKAIDSKTVNDMADAIRSKEGLLDKLLGE